MSIQEIIKRELAKSGYENVYQIANAIKKPYSTMKDFFMPRDKINHKILRELCELAGVRMWEVVKEAEGKGDI